MLRPEDISIQRIEDASAGLAYIMRRYNSVFWHQNGGRYFIHVPKNLRDHRSYQYWTVTKQQVDGADQCLKDGQSPFRWMEEAAPPNRAKRRKPLKGYGYKRSI